MKSEINCTGKGFKHYYTYDNLKRKIRLSNRFENVIKNQMVPKKRTFMASLITV